MSVVISKCEDYQKDRLQSIVDGLFCKLGVYDEIKEGMTVVIKPNLIMRSKPDAAIITHPNVIEAVGKAVQKAGARVLIAESSGGVFTPAYVKNVFAGCGYSKMAQENGFELYTECKSREVFAENAMRCKSFEVVEPFLTADYIIDIAKLKTHGMTMMSGAVKNLFGVVPGLLKPELHCRFPDKTDFAEMLVDLCDLIKPQLSIIDAVFGMEGNGPTGGEPRYVGLIMGSESPYELDVAAAEIIGLEPMSVPMIKNAADRGFVKPDELEITGETLESVKVKDFRKARASSADFIDRLPQFLRPLAGKLSRPKPVINKKNCIGCGKCAESCPQKIIEIKDGLAKIELDTCIRCFCCHEMCPEHAVKIKRLGVFNL